MIRRWDGLLLHVIMTNHHNHHEYVVLVELLLVRQLFAKMLYPIYITILDMGVVGVMIDGRSSNEEVGLIYCDDCVS